MDVTAQQSLSFCRPTGLMHLPPPACWLNYWLLKQRAVHIVTHEDFVPFFADAPAQLRFITHRRENGKMSTMRLLGEAMGHNWNRVISLTATRLPFLLWARHRHLYRFAAGGYALPALFANDKLRPPHIWTPDKLHLALPETLAPDTPLVVLALSENSRTVWDWRHYAELIWRLSDSIDALQQAHIVVLAHRDCALADSLMEKIPPGQISRFDDLPFAKQGGLMRRARWLSARTGWPCAWRPVSARRLCCASTATRQLMKADPMVFISGKMQRKWRAMSGGICRLSKAPR